MQEGLISGEKPPYNIVESKTTRIIARLLWFAPALLLFLTINQAIVATDLRSTWETGTPATAEVLEYETTNRVDVTLSYISLRVHLADGQTITKEKMSLPKSLLPRVAGEDELEVRVQPGAAQEIVIARLMPGHWLIAASQAAMACVAMIIFGIGVYWWNGYLRKQSLTEESVS